MTYDIRITPGVAKYLAQGDEWPEIDGPGIYALNASDAVALGAYAATLSEWDNLNIGQRTAFRALARQVGELGIEDEPDPAANEPIPPVVLPAPAEALDEVRVTDIPVSPTPDTPVPIETLTKGDWFRLDGIHHVFVEVTTGPTPYAFARKYGANGPMRSIAVGTKVAKGR